MTTIADLINEIERELLHHYTAPQLDQPASSITTTATEIALSTADNVARGSLLDIDFEQMYVTNWIEGTRTATVIRGLYGTTATSHATTALVRINPRVSSIALLDAIRDEINGWDERLFATEADSVSFSSADYAVDVSPARVPYRVLWARPRPPSNTPYTRIGLQLRRKENASVFANTYSLHLPPGLMFGDTTTVDVLYAVPFDTSTLAGTTDLQSTVGLTTPMLEILKWGALYRVLAGRTEGRLDPFANLRPEAEQNVPATSLMQGSAQYLRMREMAFNREYERLLGLYPPMVTWV